MSTHVAITGFLCLLLVVALVKYRGGRTSGTSGQARAGSVRARLGKTTLRLGRGTRQREPEPPRQRRHRPRLGLTVSGVPTEEALLRTADELSGPATEDPIAERSTEDNDAAILELAAGTAVGDDSRSAAAIQPAAEAPLADDALRDHAGEEFAVALNEAAHDATVIEAPGWPQPGELGLSSATDGFADAGAPEIGDEDEDAGDLITPTPIVAAHAPEEDHAAPITDVMWDGPVADPDPESGWDPPEEDPAEPAPAAPAPEWSTADLDALLDESWTLPAAIDEVPVEMISREAEVTDDGAWNVAEWELASVAAPETAAAVHGSTHDLDPLPSAGPEDAAVFTWPSDDLEAEPELDAAAGVPSSQDIEELTDAAAPAPEAASWEMPGDTPAAPADEAPRAPTDPIATPSHQVRDTRTTQLEQRVAAAEAELRRIAKRTKGKKGDLRRAGKDKIAKQVRKALGDPEIAHHFDLQVGKGRFAFARRSAELPVVTLGETVDRAADDGATGSELLTALEGPLRANLLAMLLRDYAHAEADRRVAALRSPNGASGTDPGEFDALVASLAELSQGALLGIEPPRQH